MSHIMVVALKAQHPLFNFVESKYVVTLICCYSLLPEIELSSISGNRVASIASTSK